MKKLFLLLISLFIYVTAANAQSVEICDNGIDDDGDGFIDCFDGDCSGNTACDGFYLGNDASCEAEPSKFPEFKLSLGYQSANNVTNSLSRIAIGDIDRDGIPEIFTQNKNKDRIYLLNGTDATVKASAAINNPEWRASMVNLEDDNCGEVFAVSVNNGYRIESFDCNLNKLWTSEKLTNDPMFIGYADFDRDGKPEMYYKDEIRDPLTGTRLVATANTNWDNVSGGPVAVDIFGDADLELVINDKIYGVSNIASRTQDAGQLTLLASMPETYKPKVGGFASGQSSTTSVADYNLDGFLDVIITGADGGNVTTVFFWDVKNNTVKKFSDKFGSGDYKNGWKKGTGRINIGDLDNDGQLNAVFVSGRYLYALKEDWSLLWKVQVNEETSGITGCTLFDFNGDGTMEIVYRDEDYLYIVNGDGTIGTPVHCRSRTSVEYPIVADVDADGSTEICVVCTSENVKVGTPGRNLTLEEPAEVRIYKSDGEPWVPARRVWNQHGYFNVNINDDLTVPKNQQKHQLVFSTGSCGIGPARPLNGFLNQSPFLNSSGCPTYASPDLTIIQSSFSIKAPDCPETDFTISFDYENIGDVPLSGNVPITFYDGDPLVAGTNKLGTEFIPLNNFTVGETGSAVDIPVSGDGGPFTLFAVLNDNGSSATTPITLPNSNFLECDYVNNIISAEVNPLPFVLSVEKTNNITCAAGSVPSNGSATVKSIIGGVDQTADNDFYWFNGTDLTATPDYVGSIYSGLAAGTYSVYAIHKLAGCTSDTLQVEITDSVRTVSAEISIVQPNTNCTVANGELSVSVDGGEPAGNYNYEWYVGNSVGGGLVISNDDTASGLNAGAYTVLVTDKATGCQTIESKEVPDGTVIPVVSTSKVDIVCSDQNSGSVTATVGGATTGYTFKWFIGPSVKPTPDFTGSTVNNLAKGKYTVLVQDVNSNCTADPVTVIVDQSLLPTITGVSSNSNTSCDSNLSNGSVSVTIAGDPAQHTIEWYAGSTTTTTVISNNASVSGLRAGEYTIKLIDNNTGCSVTDKVSIQNSIVKPTVDLAMEPVTQCSPFNGRVTATVDLNSVSDYTFSWYDGKQVKSSRDYTETSHILDNLEAGFYTVRAFNNLTNCFADAKTIEVIDEATVAIIQTAADIQPSTECNEANGVLQVQVNSPNNTSGFLVEWYSGSKVSGSPFFSETGVTVSIASNLFTGLYTVQATDLDNGCSNEQIFNLPFANSHLLVTTDTVNATNCIPDDGSITVSLTPTPLAGFDESNYELRLYANNDISTTPYQTLPGILDKSDYTFTDLPEGSYIIEALADATLGNCSVYSFAEIELEATDPVISEVNNMPNINCSVAAATGVIEINIDEGLNPLDYDIKWYEGSVVDATKTLGTTTGATAGVNGEIANNLIGGNYTVEVINKSTQCSTIGTFGVIDDPTIVTINTSDLLITPITLCDSVNSKVLVSNIYENGVLANKGDYVFEWYDQAMNILPDAITPNTADSIAGIDAGIYFVKAINTQTGCETTLNEFEIANEIVDPTITLTFQNPERCAIASTGELHVTATSPGFTFTYNWYAGSTATGPVIQTGPDYVGLSEGIFTVEIINDSSNCVYLETYELETIINAVNISASATPVTNCDSPDGTVFATITSPGNYTYSWTDSNGNVVGTGKRVASLPEGEYTVVAVDTNDAFCQNTATVSVTNEQVLPELTVMQTAPLSVCDLDRSNGAARALVNGEFVGYTFEWFEGTSATGDIIFTGPEFSQMRDIAYTVRATNNVSQCATEQTITISSDIPLVPNPSIEVLAQDTHCTIDNGSLSASVLGSTNNYIFNWYIGDKVGNSPYFTGDRIEGLAAGVYTVTATNSRTGCVSSPVTAEIIEDLTYPEFSFIVEGVNCDEYTGFASVSFTNNVQIGKIEWRNENGSLLMVGPNLSDVPAGTYSVLVETSTGCITEEEVIIPTEISPFNGISRNGDASNSYFKIDCITNFPNNIVKIYNRAGTKVYEVTGYDNNTKLFDGVSNRGINVMGQNVPDGTYFYVIDKNDGSKPVTGYLEIVN